MSDKVRRALRPPELPRSKNFTYFGLARETLPALSFLVGRPDRVGPQLPGQRGDQPLPRPVGVSALRPARLLRRRRRMTTSPKAGPSDHNPRPTAPRAPTQPTESLFSYGTCVSAKSSSPRSAANSTEDSHANVGFELDWVTITDPHVIATSGSDRHPILRPTRPAPTPLSRARYSPSAQRNWPRPTPTKLTTIDASRSRCAQASRAWVYVFSG